MRKLITIFLLFLFFVRCSENEEPQPPSRRPGPEKIPPVLQKSALVKQGSAPAATEPLIRKKVHPERKHKTIASAVGPIAETPARRLSDTALIRTMILLNKQDLEIDFREPWNRQFILAPGKNSEFPSMIVLSHDRSLKINFDNDIFDNTDRYYTNGIRFDFISPFLKQFPLSWCLVPYWGKATNYYGLSIGQNMYTPYTTKTGGIHYGDRPYAAYLFVGSFKISNDPLKRFRQTSEIDLGVIGPSSFGDFIQKSFHNSVPTNNEPLGWEYQIQDDLLLDYLMSFEKGIITMKNIEFDLNAKGVLGTLYTNLSGGFRFQAGLFYPYFATPGYSRRSQNKDRGYSDFQCFVFVTSDGKLVGYDATLEGGLFNRSSIYTLKPSEISLLTYQGTVGISFSWEGVRIDLEQYLLSPEFHHGAWHKWVHIGLIFGI